VSRSWPELLSEFDDLAPPLDLWHRTVSRTPQRPPRQRIPRLPQRLSHALVLAAVLAAALGGMLFGSLLHHDQEPLGPPARQPSRVGAEAWLNVVVADVQARIAVTRLLIRRDQCFTPQWSYLATPIFVDLTAYEHASSRTDPRAALGHEFTNLNNRCSVYARQGGMTGLKRTAILTRLNAVDRAVAAIHPVGAAPPASLDRWIGLLLADVRTRVPIARRMIANSQCGNEVQKIASPIQSDIDLALLYAAPTTHTFAEGVRAQPLLQLGSDFMGIVGPCFRDLRTGQLSTQERTSLADHVTVLQRRLDQALGG
jgi:hypothetical protein